MLTFTSVHPSSVFLNWVFSKGAGKRFVHLPGQFLEGLFGRPGKIDPQLKNIILPILERLVDHILNIGRQQTDDGRLTGIPHGFDGWQRPVPAGFSNQ